METEKAAISHETTEEMTPERVLSDQQTWFRAERQRVVDVVLEKAYELGWCFQVLVALDLVYGKENRNGAPCYPEPDNTLKTWRTSDGYDVYGRDTNGKDRDGIGEEYCPFCRRVH